MRKKFTFLLIIGFLLISGISCAQERDTIFEEEIVYDVLDLEYFKFYFATDSISPFKTAQSFTMTDINPETLSISYQNKTPYDCGTYDNLFYGPNECNDTSYLYKYGNVNYMFNQNYLILGQIKTKTIFCSMSFLNRDSYVVFNTDTFNSNTSINEIKNKYHNSYKQSMQNPPKYDDRQLTIFEFHPHAFEYYEKHPLINSPHYDWKFIWHENWQLIFKNQKLIAIRFIYGT